MTLNEREELISYYTDLYNKKIISKLALDLNLHILNGGN